jgi:hypothetical protein
MLMDGRRMLKPGDAVKIRISTQSGSGASADFVVRDAAP